jgi:hypothetical protein
VDNIYLRSGEYILPKWGILLYILAKWGIYTTEVGNIYSQSGEYILAKWGIYTTEVGNIYYRSGEYYYIYLRSGEYILPKYYMCILTFLESE